MKRFLSLSMCALLLVSLSGLAIAGQGSADRDYSGYKFTEYHADAVLTSSGSADARFKAVTGTDTFCLYGGPGSLHGKFQTASFAPLTRAQMEAEPSTMSGLVPPEADGWVFLDASDQEIFWQSSTFMMDNLNSNGGGNSGMWVGRTAAQVGWANAPGYGNSWNALLEWRTTDIDPANSQSVSVDWFYNLDSEAGFDFFEVEYDSAGSTIIALSVSGSSKGSISGVFDAPGVVGSLTLPYEANSYASGNTEISLRMAGRSDGGYSDEDSIIDTDGLVQVDDITVGWTDAGGLAASDTDNFEGGDTGPNWTPTKPPFAGYFGRVFGAIEDQDPCRENVTPVFAFIDDGTPPSNPDYVGTGTGGTTSLNWTYGVPGNWVVNYNGGITNNQINLENQILIPPTAWDLPGTADDGPQVAGAFFRTTIWRHLPLLNGFFYTWDVRARDSVTGTWGGWANRGFVYYGGGSVGDWLNVQNDVSDLLITANGPDGVQLRVICLDAANVFSFPGTDATISPFFDNVALFKYVIGGPTFSTRTIDLFNDSFNSAGLSDHSSEAARGALDIRIDMARDINTGTANTPGDSIIIDITSVIPGSSVNAMDITMFWALHKNPYFEDTLRGNLTAYPGVAVSAGGGYNSWDMYTGSAGVVGGGPVAADRFAFDFPDSDFAYPGDIVEYYIQATDDGGGTGGTPLTSTFPANLNGFANGGSQGKNTYSRLHTIRGLPTLTSGGQPNILLINDFGHRGGENDYLSAFGQIGYEEGADSQTSGANPGGFDTYTVRGPSSGIDNGIGSEGAHGADASQLSDYSCMIYVAGNLSSFLLSNGSDMDLNDKGDDIGNLTDWQNQAANRNIAYFGDSIGTSVSASSTTYLNTIMGVSYVANSVSPLLNDVVAPDVEPTADGISAGFVADWAAFGGCLGINSFDQLDPFAAGVDNYVSHEYLGTMGTSANAGIVFDRLDAGFRKVNVTFSHGLVYVYNGGDTGAGGGISDRAVLMNELLTFFGGHAPGAGDVTDVADIAKAMLKLNVFPNPFNPRTEIQFTTGVKGPVTIKVYNLAGRLVKTLLQNEVFEGGSHSVTWNGVDNSGASVASGVYIARVNGNNLQKTAKMVLMK